MQHEAFVSRQLIFQEQRVKKQCHVSHFGITFAEVAYYGAFLVNFISIDIRSYKKYQILITFLFFSDVA